MSDNDQNEEKLKEDDLSQVAGGMTATGLELNAILYASEQLNMNAGMLRRKLGKYALVLHVKPEEVYVKFFKEKYNLSIR